MTTYEYTGETPADQRRREHDAAVLAYVRRHPRCTAREIARGCFGGHGGTKTAERKRAAVSLLRLYEAGKVVRLTREFRGGTSQGYAYEIPDPG